MVTNDGWRLLSSTKASSTTALGNFSPSVAVYNSSIDVMLETFELTFPSDFSRFIVCCFPEILCLVAFVTYLKLSLVSFRLVEACNQNNKSKGSSDGTDVRTSPIS